MRTKRFRTWLASVAVMLCMLLAFGAGAQVTLSYHKLDYRPASGADTLGAMPDNYTGSPLAADGTNAKPYRLVFYPSMDSLMSVHNTVRTLTASTYNCGADYSTAFSQTGRDLFLHATSTSVGAIKITFTPNNKTKDYIARLAVKNRTDVNVGNGGIFSNNDYIFNIATGKEFAQLSDSGRFSSYDAATKALKITYTPGNSYFQSATANAKVQGKNVITVTYEGVDQIAVGDLYRYEFSKVNSADVCGKVIIEGLKVQKGQVLCIGLGNGSPKWTQLELSPITNQVLDFSAIDSLGKVVVANAKRETGAKYIGDLLGAKVDTIKFVPSSDFMTFAAADKLRDLVRAAGNCIDDVTHQVTYGANNTNQYLNLRSTPAQKVEIYTNVIAANNYLPTSLGKTRTVTVPGSQGQDSTVIRLDTLYSFLNDNMNTTSGIAGNAAWVDSAFSPTRTVATYKFKNRLGTDTVTIKVEAMTFGTIFATSWQLSPAPAAATPACLKMTISGINIPKGEAMFWRFTGNANAPRYLQMAVYPDNKPEVDPTGIAITNAPVGAAVGTEYTMQATLDPANATNKRIVWSIVNAAGSGAAITTTGKLTAKSAGNPVVRAASAAVPSIYVDTTITFIVRPATAIAITGIPKVANGNVEINKAVTLGSKLTPADVSYKSVTYSMVNAGTTQATITKDGKLIATKTGTAIVRALVDSTKTIFADSSIVFYKNAVTGVTISRAPATDLVIGSTIQLGTTVVPANASLKSLTWASSDSTTIAVSARGVITALKAGSANITVASVDEPSITDVKAFTVAAGGAPVAAGNSEVLVIYENFGGANTVAEEGITPQAWPQVHADSSVEGTNVLGGWRIRTENMSNLGAASVAMPQLHNSCMPIDTIIKYKPGVDTTIAVNDDQSFNYGVKLHNGYRAVINGANVDQVNFKMYNMAVAPHFYPPLYYDTVMVPGGKYALAVGKKGWEKTYSIPDESKKGYLYFGNNTFGNGTVPTVLPTLTIPNNSGDYLPNVSRVEFEWSGSRLAVTSMLVAIVEYLNDQGATTKLDTFTYTSIGYTPINISLPIEGGERVRLHLKSTSSNTLPSAGLGGSYGGFNYPLNLAEANVISNGVQTVAPHTFNRALAANLAMAAATTLPNNIASHLHSVKVYAKIGAGYTIVEENGATAAKTSGIQTGESVAISAPATNNSKGFRGWRINGKDDISLPRETSIKVAENLTIRPLYAGDMATVAVVNETFTDWEAAYKPALLAGDAATGLTYYTDGADTFKVNDKYGRVSKTVKMPLRYGFTTPNGDDMVNVTLKYANVVPNSTIRVSNAPGAEQWKGYIGLSSSLNSDKGYFEVDTLSGITKMMVELSTHFSLNNNHVTNSCAAVAVLENGRLIRNVANLGITSATKEEIALSGNAGKLTIGYPNQAKQEYLVSTNTNVLDTFGVHKKTTLSARYAAMHSLKLYATIALPEISTDATLRELTLKGADGTVIPFTAIFDPATKTYTASSTYKTKGILDSAVTISAIVNNFGAKITSGLGHKSLPTAKAYSFEIKVLAEDGVTEATYTVNLTRYIRSTDATLSSLTASGITLTPAFSPLVTTYTARNVEVSSTTIAAVANSADATVTGTGAKDLVLGSNSFIVKVVAEDTTCAACKHDYTVNILRTPVTAVETEEYAVRLYPNPVVTGELTVEDSDWKEGTAIEIYDMNGVLVVTSMSIGERTTLSVSQLPNGTYLLKMGKKVATKFVKQ